MNCLADSGTDFIGIAIALAVLVIGVGLALVLRHHHCRRAASTALVIVAALFGVGALAAVPASPASAAECTPAPPAPPAPPPPPPVDGIVTALDITLDRWVAQAPCAAGMTVCVFTVDVTTLGDTTTNPGATIDFNTFLSATPPPGYTFAYDPAAAILTLTVTTSAPGQASTYVIDDTTGELSNVANIQLPVIPQAIDLTIAATLTPPITTAGASTVQSITITNLSATTPSTAGTIVRISIPSLTNGVPVVSGTNWSSAIQGSFLVMTYAGIVAPSGTADVVQVTWTVIASAAPGTQPLTATIGTRSGGDTVPSNNSAIVILTVVPG